MSSLEHLSTTAENTSQKSKERCSKNIKSELDVCVIVHHYYNDVNNKQDATTFSFINLFKSALHVSSDKFAHPQEHFLTVYTAFGTEHRHCC